MGRKAPLSGDLPLIKSENLRKLSHPEEMGVILMDMAALIISIIGCINWGLVGIFQFDLVAWLFGGSGALLSRIVYTVVGLAGLWCISFLFRKKEFTQG